MARLEGAADIEDEDLNDGETDENQGGDEENEAVGQKNDSTDKDDAPPG